MNEGKFDLAMQKNGFQSLFCRLLRMKTDLLREDVVAVYPSEPNLDRSQRAPATPPVIPALIVCGVYPSAS